MRVQQVVFIIMASTCGVVAQTKLNDTDAALAVITAKQAAFAQASSAFCSEKDPPNRQRYQAALDGWQQRNHWAAIEAGPVLQEMQPDEFAALRSEARSQLEAHRFRSVMLCATLARSLHTAERDPSVQHAQEISRIAEASTVLPVRASARGEKPVPQPPSTQPVRKADAGAERSFERSAAASPAEKAADVSTAAQTTDASGGEFGDISFTPPKGWTVGRSSSAGVSFLKGSPDRGRWIITLASLPLQGHLLAGFKQSVVRAFPGTGLTLRYTQQGRTPAGLAAVSASDGGNLRSSRTYANLRAVGIAAPGNQLLLVELLSTSGVGYLLDAEKDFATTVRSIRSKGTRETAGWSVLHPPAGSGGQRGVFWSNRLQNQLNPPGGMDLRAIREYMVLLPGGQAYNDLPNDGHVLDIDIASSCAKKPLRCGTYQVSGGSIHFVFPNEYGLLIDSTGKWNGNGGTWSSGNYVALQPVHAMHLDGRYTTTNYMSGNTATSSTGIVSQNYIQFTADGHFQKAGFASATFSNSGASGTVSSRGREAETGQYSLEEYTLTLQPDRGGAPEQYTLLFETVSPTAKAIWINDNTYFRESSR